MGPMANVIGVMGPLPVEFDDVIVNLFVCWPDHVNVNLFACGSGAIAMLLLICSLPGSHVIVNSFALEVAKSGLIRCYC